VRKSQEIPTATTNIVKMNFFVFIITLFFDLIFLSFADLIASSSNQNPDDS
jgi:hypothetical protein